MPGSSASSSEVSAGVLIGTEHEYSLNTPGMAPVPESDLVLAELAGEGASEAALGTATLTKELQKTVIELLPAGRQRRSPGSKPCWQAGSRSFTAGSQAATC